MSEKEYTLKELEAMISKQKKGTRRRKRKMKTEKKALWSGLMACIILIVFSMVMVVIDKDTQTTAIFGAAGVTAIPFIFGIYEKFSTDINLKHMEKNYIQDYDEKEGLR